MYLRVSHVEIARLSDRSPGPGEAFDGGVILVAGMGIRVTSDGDLIV